MVEGAGVGGWVAGSEGESGEVAAEVGEPGFEDGGGDEVDFIEDEDEAFGAGVCGGDFSLYFLGACAVGVAGVENVEEDVGGGEDGFEDFIEGAAGGFEGLRTRCWERIWRYDICTSF